MKKLSIKMKLTLWFMLFMLLLSGIVFAFIRFVSASETRRNTENALIARVGENAQRVEYRDEKLIIGEDFVSYRNGVYCLVFNEDGEVRGGQVPDEALENEALREGPVRELTVDGEEYLIYDLKVDEKRRDIWIRGAVSRSGETIGSAGLYSAVFISADLEADPGDRENRRGDRRERGPDPPDPHGRKRGRAPSACGHFQPDV